MRKLEMNISAGILLLMVFSHLQLTSQYVIASEAELEDLKQLSQEVLYAAHTGPVLFPGEYLYFSLFCQNAQTRRNSSISRIAYVDIISPENELVLRGKVLLKSGLGQGSFFIPVEMRTGSYKILAYTNWMKNSGLKQVFQDDLLIINPYREDAYTSPDSNMLQDSIITPKEEHPLLSLQLESDTYNTREKVVLRLRNYRDKLGYGSYSLRVQKIEEIPFKMAKTSIEFSKIYQEADKVIPSGVGDSLYLPEQRGELIYGTIKPTLEKTTLKGAEVAINFPGEKFLLDFSFTDDKGNFYSYIQEPKRMETVLIQAVTGIALAIDKVNTPSPLKYTKPRFAAYSLPDSLRQAILDRSIYNQIENQYFDVKPDSVVEPFPYDPFQGGVLQEIILDDYTRFKTLKETLEEVVPFAGFRRKVNKAVYVRIAQDFKSLNEPFNNDPALVLVDGMFIDDPGTLEEMDAQQIESISLVRESYIFGTRTYHGILYIKTKEGDFYNTVEDERIMIKSISKPQDVIKYFKQVHSSDSNHIPDYRRLLLWQPQVKLESSLEELEFYTSDVQGPYEIVLDGFTTYGKPVSVRKAFYVKGKNSESE